METDHKLSNLPEDVLRHILSFLPTKYAAGTSILSTRWKSLSSSLLNLDFDDSSFLHPRPATSDDGYFSHMFEEFVDKVLQSNTAPNIHSFLLKCRRYHGESKINDWISAMLSRNVRKLDLSTSWYDRIFEPPEFHKCNSLEFLRLHNVMFPKLPESGKLTNLKVLHLVETTVHDDGTIRSYFSSCPALEDYSMIDCTLFEVDVFEVRHTSLKKLTLHYCDGYFDLVLDTPSLQHLEYCYIHSNQTCVTENIKSLVSAGSRLQLYDRCTTSFSKAAKFINDMHNVKSLHLSYHALDAIFLSGRPLATFRNLTYMELGFVDTSGWRMLQGLLDSSPNLEVLVFYDGFVDYDKYGQDRSEFHLPHTRPVCLSRSLTEIKIGAFGGTKCEMELVEYFLMWGEVLREVMVSSSVYQVSPFGFLRCRRNNFDVPPPWLSHTLKTLAVAPRCSKTCQVVINWNEDGNTCSTTIN